MRKHPSKMYNLSPQRRVCQVTYGADIYVDVLISSLYYDFGSGPPSETAGDPERRAEYNNENEEGDKDIGLHLSSGIQLNR